MNKIGKLYNGGQLKKLASLIKETPKNVRAIDNVNELVIGNWAFRQSSVTGVYILHLDPKGYAKRQAKVESERTEAAEGYISTAIHRPEAYLSKRYYDRRIK